MKGRNMASLESDFFPEVEETLIIEDDGPVQPEDALVNTKGASLNYTKGNAGVPSAKKRGSLGGERSVLLGGLPLPPPLPPVLPEG